MITDGNRLQGPGTAVGRSAAAKRVEEESTMADFTKANTHQEQSRDALIEFENFQLGEPAKVRTQVTSAAAD